MLENVLLGQQLTVLGRQEKRSRFTGPDRGLLVLLACKLATWQQALLIVQPNTLLRWHRDLFKCYWAHKSKRKGGHHTLSVVIIALINRTAVENRLWDA